MRRKGGETVEKATLKVAEAAKILDVSLPTMYDITERADFTALIRVGRKKLILKSRFYEWLEQQTSKGGE